MELGRFDPDYEMFVREPHDPDMNHLRELRWRAERGYFGYQPVSIPKGDNVFRLTDREIRHYAMIEIDKELKFAPTALPTSNYQQTIE